MYQPIGLPYGYYDLQEFLSAKTLEIHYNKLYLEYLLRLNQVLLKNNFQFQYPKEELFNRISEFPIKDRDMILYNAGGAINHEIYFNSMTKEKTETIPEPLYSALLKSFGTIEVFKNQIINQAIFFAGSGYTFLVVNELNNLQIISQSNQDTPYLIGMIPIMAIDIWEHSYYLDYTVERKKYVNQFFDYINWDFVNKAYQKAITK